MKVKDLIEQLISLDPNLDLVMSKDAEGNKFSPIDEFTVGQYESETSWSGEFDDSAECESNPNSVCFWPKN
jgi:hypothetical protein